MTLALLLLGAPPAGASAGPDYSFFVMMALIFVVFYFFLIRPQKRREQERRALIEAVKKGDKVVTIGGIHGKVLQVDEGSVVVDVDTNTKLRLDKAAISTVVGDPKKASVKETAKK